MSIFCHGDKWRSIKPSGVRLKALVRNSRHTEETFGDERRKFMLGLVTSALVRQPGARHAGQKPASPSHVRLIPISKLCY